MTGVQYVCITLGFSMNFPDSHIDPPYTFFVTDRLADE